MTISIAPSKRVMVLHLRLEKTSMAVRVLCGFGVVDYWPGITLSAFFSVLSGLTKMKLSRRDEVAVCMSG